GPSVPDAAKTVGVALFGAMLATLGLAYFLLRYGGSPAEDE
ncbi:MAG: halocyanin, partial [Actinobacteria bacterium]|nr:halocyanin [Actinomycetota bacterium]